MFGTYKKKMLLNPTGYSKNAMIDIINFVVFYKEDFDIYISVIGLDEEIVDMGEYKYVNADKGSKYLTYLNYTADFIIDAGTMGSKYKVSDNQFLVSVWHGIPYKKMFVDFDKQTLKSTIGYGYCYDAMISGSPFYTNTFLKGAMMYRGDIIESGCSRADSYFNVSNDQKKEIRNKINVSDDKKILLYAPTFRDEGPIDLPFDPHAMQNALGDNWVIIVRLHYLNELKDKYSDSIIDCSDYEGIIDLMVISDAMISDYSSAILDYALLNKPIYLYQYDKDEYFKERDVYFDINEYIPKSHVAYEEKEIYELISTDQGKPEYSKLIETFHPYEDGHSTERIVEALNFNRDLRQSKDLIFLINDLNEMGGIHSFIQNMAEYYKTKYNTKIYVMGVNQFALHREDIYLFECEYVDYFLSLENHKKACSSILQNTDGVIITLQFHAQKKFQKWLNGKNNILMFHGDTKDVIDKTLYKHHLDLLNDKKLYNYKKLLFLSEKNAELIKPHLKKEVAEKVGYMPNSIGLPYRETFTPDSLVFSYIGRLDKDKNPMALIELGKEIKKSGEEITINIYGDGRMKNDLHNEILHNELEKILILKGYESDKDIIFKDSQGLVMLSQSEGFPLTILESYSKGKPVVLFNTFATAEELVIDGQTGYLIENNDYMTFVKSLLEVSKLETDAIKKHYLNYENETVFNRWNELFNIIDSENTLKPKKTKSKPLSFNEKVKRKLRVFKKKTYNRLSDKKKHTLRDIKYNKYEKDSIKKLNSLGECPKISVVIPCYNNNNTIKNTIKSVQNQRYDNIEIIIVEDGSEQSSEEIIKSIKDSRIKYFYKNNEGPGLARNYGIEKSTGELLFFLDADDTMYIGALANMLSYMIEKEVDVVSALTERYYVERNEYELWYYDIYKKNRIDSINSRKDIYKDTLTTNKLYKKTFLTDNDILFEKGLYEDKIFTALIYAKTDKIGILDKMVYSWFVYGSDTSITTTKTVKNFLQRIVAIEKVMSVTPEKKKIYVCNLFVSHDLLIYLREYNLYDIEDKNLLFKKAKAFYEKYRTYIYLDLVKFKYQRYYIRCLKDNSFKDFSKLAALISSVYIKDIKENKELIDGKN